MEEAGYREILARYDKDLRSLPAKILGGLSHRTTGFVGLLSLAGSALLFPSTSDLALFLGAVSFPYYFFDSAPPWDWKAVENLAESKGLTAKEVAAMIRSRKSRGKS